MFITMWNVFNATWCPWLGIKTHRALCHRRVEFGSWIATAMKDVGCRWCHVSVWMMEWLEKGHFKKHPQGPQHEVFQPLQCSEPVDHGSVYSVRNFASQVRATS